MTIIASNEIIYEVLVENPHNWFQSVTERNLDAVTFIRPRTTSIQNYGIILTVDLSSSHKLRCFWSFQQSRWFIALQTNMCTLLTLHFFQTSGIESYLYFLLASKFELFRNHIQRLPNMVKLWWLLSLQWCIAAMENIQYNENHVQEISMSELPFTIDLFPLCLTSSVTRAALDVIMVKANYPQGYIRSRPFLGISCLQMANNCHHFKGRMYLQCFNFKINVYKKYQIHSELEPWEHELFINDEKWSEHASS